MTWRLFAGRAQVESACAERGARKRPDSFTADNTRAGKHLQSASELTRTQGSVHSAPPKP